MKYVLIIGDGMADNPVPCLGGKTPLMAAQKDAIDHLAARAVVGSVRTVPKGLPPGSDTAILSIFGYDPSVYYTGRSPLEAAGCGVAIEAGDVSYRMNMVALSDEQNVPFAARKMLSHSGGSVEGGQSLALLDALKADAPFMRLAAQAGMTFHGNPSFRHIATQKGFALDGFSATPPHDILDLPIGGYLPKGNAAAPLLCALMERAFAVLEPHPVNARRRAAGHLAANCIWFWAEGRGVSLPSFYDKFGKKGAVISAVPLVHGIGALAGLTPVHVPGATGELDTNYAGKVHAALNALAKGADFVCVHVEAPDECTHCGDLDGKLAAIRLLSEEVVAPLTAALQGPFRLLLLSDHKTLTDTRTHDGDPVPYLLYDSQSETQCGGAYDEAAGQKGPYIARGEVLLESLFK